MSTKRKGTTRILLPDGPVDAEYDDDEPTEEYDPVLAAELVDAAHAYIDAHPEIVPSPGRPSLSRGQGSRRRR